MPDHPFAVDDDDASPQQPELLDDKSVLHAEVKIAVIRVDMDILDMFCGAESLLGERQIYRQGEDGYVFVQFCSLLVEPDVLQCAYRGIHRRENTDDQIPVLELCNRYGLQVLVRYLEHRSPVAYGQMGPDQCGRVSAECNYP